MVLDSLKAFDSAIRRIPVADNELAITIAERAIRLAGQKGGDEEKAYAYFLAGMAGHLKNPDSSYNDYEKSLKLLEKSPHENIKPRVVYNLAMLYVSAFNYKDALVLLDSSLRLAGEMHDFSTLSNCYNSIGNVELSLLDTNEARNNFKKSLQVAESHHLERQAGVTLGSLASIEKDQDSAKGMFSRAMSCLKKEAGTEEELSYILINLGNITSGPDSAVKLYQSALIVAEQGHLPEVSIAALNNMAYSLLEMNQIGKAEESLRDKAIPIAEKTKNLDWLSTLYDSYADVLKRKKDFSKALIYQKKALDAKTEAVQEQANTQVQLLNTLLKAKNREIRIKIQAGEIRAKQNRIRLMFVSIMILFLLIIMVIIAFLMRIQRKNLNIRIREIETSKKIALIEEKEHERISMQLHDMIGPLRTIMLKHLEEIDFGNTKIKAEIKSILDSASAQIRQISHRLNPVMREELGFNELARGIREDFQATSGIKVTLTLPTEDLKLSKDCINHLYFILQELMMNAGRHSRATSISLGISAELDNLYVIYQDDGCGFKTEEKASQGLGLMHIFERAKLLQGKAEVISSPGKGVKWVISVPLRHCSQSD